MSRSGGLLQRLRAVARQEDTAGLNDAILENLSRLLNARQGSVPACMDYGLPDLNDLNADGQETLRNMRRALRDAIGMYEPRLLDVMISFDRHEEDPLTLRFSIAARIEEDGVSRAVRYRTTVDPGGRFELQG